MSMFDKVTTNEFELSKSV